MKSIFLILPVLIFSCKTTNSNTKDITLSVPWPINESGQDAEKVYFTLAKIRSGKHDYTASNEFAVKLNIIFIEPTLGISGRHEIRTTSQIPLKVNSLPTLVLNTDGGNYIMLGKDFFEFIKSLPYYLNNKKSRIYLEFQLLELDAYTPNQILDCRWVTWDALRNDGVVILGDQIGKEKVSDTSTAWVTISNKRVEDSIVDIKSALKSKILKSIPCEKLKN